MIARRVAMAVTLALSAGACDFPDFDPISRVTTLRVLSVEADRPYAAPGEDVTLTVTAHDPEQRPLQYAWAACLNPVASTVEGCLAKLEQDAEAGEPALFAVGPELSTFSFRVPDDAISRLPVPAQRNALMGIVNVVCPGELSLDGDAPSLPFRCSDQDGKTLQLPDYIAGIKRVYLRPSDRNQNPTIARVTFDGEDWPEDEVPEVDSCDSDKNAWEDCKNPRHKLGVFATPESFEAGRNEYGNDFSEQLIVDYYATEGIFEYEVRIASEPETGFVARKQSAGQDVRLWFVLRDNRGGVSHVQRTIRVR